MEIEGDLMNKNHEPRLFRQKTFATGAVPVVPLAVHNGVQLTPEEKIDLEKLLPIYKKSNDRLLVLEGRIFRAIFADNEQKKRRAYAALKTEDLKIKEFLKNHDIPPFFAGVDSLSGFVKVLKNRLETIVRKQNGAPDVTRVVLK